MGETSDDPFSPLIGVHEDFVDKLTELEATLDEMMATRETREGNDIILDEAVRFFAEELMPHLRLEDEALLPALEMAIGRYGTLVTVIMSEHEEIRRGIGKFDDAREHLRRDPDSWPAIQELNRHGIFLVQFLWDHFRKENTSLFPSARKVLSADAIRKITEQISAPRPIHPSSDFRCERVQLLPICHAATIRAHAKPEAVAAPPRDHMHVRVEHLLPGFLPVREIEADRLASDPARAERAGDFLCRFEDRPGGARRQVLDVFGVGLRNHEHVSRVHRLDVHERERRRVLADDTRGRLATHDLAE